MIQMLLLMLVLQLHDTGDYAKESGKRLVNYTAVQTDRLLHCIAHCHCG